MHSLSLDELPAINRGRQNIVPLLHQFAWLERPLGFGLKCEGREVGPGRFKISVARGSDRRSNCRTSFRI